VKLGFSILSHQAPTLLFQRLLCQLDKFPDKEIAIHHDFNQTEFDKTLLQGTSYELVTDYVRTYWSHTNNIKAILETFKMLYSKDCDWYITLSTNCYPVKSVDYILHFMSTTKYDGFIERNNIWTDHFNFYQYFRKGFLTKYMFKVPFVTRQGKVYQKAIRKRRDKSEILFNDSFIPYHGSDWFAINKKAMKFILESEEKINKIVLFLADVNKGPDINVCPPEVVFQTILGNNKNLFLNNNYYRFTDWENAKDWHPNTLTIRHWNALQSSDALFARKFKWEESKDVIELIDSEILRT